ncbi:prepilin-type N-terminal cleavage/methylation domain-containing protein [Candidatus Roizmanbacteria bacterium]|nr:prepilin-type N-terminal cleavage/methylation domain-containing protein [Candidatus Roizmanbacteria bacterium]
MKGQTLVEVLVALAIAVVVITSITVLSIASLSNAQFVRDQSQATKYAQEGIEAMRSLRNSNYSGFATYNGIYCLGAGSQTLGAAVASCAVVNLDNKFIRSVQIQPGALNVGCGVNLSSVVVTVAWTDGRCIGGSFCHSSKNSSCFTTIPPVTGP